MSRALGEWDARDGRIGRARRRRGHNRGDCVAPTPAPTPSTTMSRSVEPHAHADGHTPKPRPTTPAPPRPTDPPRAPPPPTDGDGEPDHQVAVSGALLAAQIAEADRIAAALSASNSKVAAATREMDALSDKSNALLESLVAARETERAATDEANSAHADLVVLEGRLATARQILRDWVFSVYSGGGGDADIAGMLDAMGSEPDAGRRPAGRPVLPHRAAHPGPCSDVKVLTAEQVRLSAAADAAEASAAAATRVIQRDKAALDKVVLAQRSKVGAAAQRCRSPRSRRPARSPASSSAPAPRPPRPRRSGCATRCPPPRSTPSRSASRAPTTPRSTPTA